MSFIRVRSANPADPQHEVDVHVRVVAADPDLYEVLDKVPVPGPRPPKIVEPVKAPVEKPKK